jgi:uncharacterized alkaline shock family protein YloU
MKLIDRVLAVILGLVTASACVFLFLLMLEIIPHEYVNNFLHNVKILWSIKLLACIGTIVVLAISLRLIFMAPKKEPRLREPQYINITSDGNIKITSEAVNDVASRSAKEIDGVVESKSNIRINEAGLNIRMSLITTTEVNLPELAASVQNTVKNSLENICGISPASIQIMIEKNQNQPQRTIK